MSDSLQPHGLYPARLLCPWDFPGKNIGVGCHVLLQGIFPTQESNPRPPTLQADSLLSDHQGLPPLSIRRWTQRGRQPAKQNRHDTYASCWSAGMASSYVGN